MSTESSYLPAIEALETLGQSLKAVRLSRAKSLRQCAAEVGISFTEATDSPGWVRAGDLLDALEV